jgi:cell wall-associated NlpC family hydrolase
MCSLALVRRLALPTFALLSLCAVLASSAPAQDATGELEGKMDELESNIDQQGSLQAEIDRQNAQIDQLIGQEAELRARAATVQAELDRRQAELDQANAALNAERDHLAQVRVRLDRAIESLESLLVGIYKSSSPDTLSVILESASWEDLLSETEYFSRVQNYDEAVVGRVTDLREEVEGTVDLLEDAQARIKVARDEVASRRQELAATEADLAAQHSRLTAARQERAANLAALQSRESNLEQELGTSIPGPGEQASLIGDDAVAPPNAPLVVKAVIEAANAINDTPYVWGGGHGSFTSSGYDCSGSVSYALHGGGLLSSPLDSGGFTGWGEPGGGNWITVYANFGHVYMYVAGLRFDTSGGAGPRWHSDARSNSGFTARHPSGF